MNNGELLDTEIVLSKNSQAEIIAPMCKDILERNNLSAKNIDKIVTTIGPGSFTGVRVGIAFAKGLKLAINKPCIGINTLEVFAAQASEIKIIPIISMAGSIFMAVYEGRKIIMPPTRFDDYSALKDFGTEFKLTGQGAIAALDDFPEFQIIEKEIIDPFILCGLGANENENSLEPLYLRGADAKVWQRPF